MKSLLKYISAILMAAVGCAAVYLHGAPMWAGTMTAVIVAVTVMWGEP